MEGGVMAKIEVRSFDAPDEHREIPNGGLDTVRFGSSTFGRSVFQPGWRWSNDVKPIAQTDRCMLRHAGLIMSGSLGVQDEDGNEMTVSAGDVVLIEPGHDAWVVGDEAVVMVDFGEDVEEYAKPPPS
jgi:hypothetical protein